MMWSLTKIASKTDFLSFLRGRDLRHGSTLHPGYSLPAMFRSLWEMATAAGVAVSLHPQWRRQSAASKGNRFLADRQPDSKHRRFWSFDFRQPVAPL